MDTLILASSSPRRKDILTSLEIPFVCVHPEIDESVCDHLPLHDRVVALALAKASEGARRFAALAADGSSGGASFRSDGDPMPQARFVLGADTLVALPAGNEWIVLGKPEDRSEAAGMTRMLAGKTHRVFTGIALLDRLTGHTWPSMSLSEVAFSEISAAELEEYLDTRDWAGAAGAYRIQGRASFHIDRIEGSWSGIMGLPIRELYDILMQAGFRISPSAGVNRS